LPPLKSVVKHFQTETENTSVWAATNIVHAKQFANKPGQSVLSIVSEVIADPQAPAAMC